MRVVEHAGQWNERDDARFGIEWNLPGAKWRAAVAYLRAKQVGARIVNDGCHDSASRYTFSAPPAESS